MQHIFEASCFCTTGYIRENNEDNFYFAGQVLDQENLGLIAPLYKQFSGESALFGVFDGMGGVSDGQIAAHIAADSFRQDCERVEHGGMLSEAFFRSAIDHMNNAVYLAAGRQKNSMGTTALLAGFCDNSIYLCNVGDSRAFRLRGGQLIQISMDHTESIPPFLLSRHAKPKLSQYIGISPDELQLEPYIAQGAVDNGDAFLLCSDGITDMLSVSEISKILSLNDDVRVNVRQLAEHALDHGGRDNITAIVVRVH